MRNLKRALSLALASVMLLGMMVVGTSAASYPDVDEKDNVEAIEVLNAVQVMIGDRGNFRPDAKVNRHEMAVIMAKLVLGNEAADNYVGSHPFTDVFPWADKYVAACYENGLVSGTSATTFSGNQPLTAVQAAAMMLRALGYKDLSKGATDWRAPVTAMANQIRLFSGVASNPKEELDRNQVAQLALNTLKSPVVDMKEGLSITGSNGDYTFTVDGNREYIVRSSRESYARAINRTESQGTSASSVGGYTIELGEHLYNGKLTLNDTHDDFGRPARKWEYDGKAIGTYAKTELLRAEYTEKVTGKMLYDLLGSSTVKEFDINVTIDGNTDNDPKNFGRAAMTRTNTDAVGATGNGVLTQVYVNGVDKVVDIAIINTYLAIASGDYNEKKDEVSLDVYNLDKSGSLYFKDTTGDKDQVNDRKAAGDDFDIKDVKKDDKFLVTVANGELKSMVAPEVLTEQTITSHKVDKYVVADKQYDYATTAQYDVEVMESFGSVDMKEVTYDIVLDKYGYLIGVEQNEKVDEYVFLTGVDDAYSHLSQKNVPANVIFMDGSMKTVTINAKKSVLEYSSNGSNTMDVKAENRPSQANMWCTYSVDSDGIYTLKAVAGETRAKSGSTPAIKVAQSVQDANSADIKINSKNISLNGDTTTSRTRVHGNNDTVYINTTLANVKVAGNPAEYYQIIDDVDTVTTGVTKVDMTVKNISDTGGTLDYKAPVNEVYTLYNDKGIVLAAVTLKAEDNATVTHYAYINSDKIDHRDYSDSDKEYSWYREAIVDGAFVMLKEVDDDSASTYLAAMEQGKWYEIKYNADGEVKGFFEVTYAANGTTAPDGVEHNDAKRPATKPYKQVGTPTIPGVQYSLNDGNWDKTLILQEDFTVSHPELKYENGTLYTGNNIDKGVYVPSDAKVIVFTEDYDKSEEFSGANMTSALNHLIDKKNFDGYVNAVVDKTGQAIVVIIDEKTEDTDEPSPLNSDIKIISTDSGSGTITTVLYTIEDSTADVPSLKELRAALVAALEEEGCTDFSWNASGALTFKDTSGSSQTSATLGTSSFKWVYKMTLKNKTGADAIYYVDRIKDVAGTEQSVWTGGQTYAVSSSNVVSTPTLNLNTSPYNNTNGTGVISNIADDSKWAYADAYGSIGSSGTIDPKATHDFIVETGYVKVTNVDGKSNNSYAKFNQAYTIPANSVTAPGSIYEWAVAGPGASGVQDKDKALNLTAAQVSNDITITNTKVKVTGAGVAANTLHDPSGDYTIPTKADLGGTEAKGTGVKWTCGNESGYAAYQTGTIAAAKITGDITLERGYVSVAFTIASATSTAFDVKYKVGTTETTTAPTYAKFDEDVSVILNVKEETALGKATAGQIVTASDTSDAADATAAVKGANSDATKIVFANTSGLKLNATHTITFKWNADGAAIASTITYTAPTGADT